MISRVSTSDRPSWAPDPFSGIASSPGVQKGPKRVKKGQKGPKTSKNPVFDPFFDPFFHRCPFASSADPYCLKPGLR